MEKPNKDRITEIRTFAQHFIVERYGDKSHEEIAAMITAFELGARWADKYPEYAFTKPSAENFFNCVMLMRANQQGFFRCKKEDPLREKYLQNSKSFESKVDDIIAKAQEIINRVNTEKYE